MCQIRKTLIYKSSLSSLFSSLLSLHFIGFVTLFRLYKELGLAILNPYVQIIYSDTSKWQKNVNVTSCTPPTCLYVSNFRCQCEEKNQNAESWGSGGSSLLWLPQNDVQKNCALTPCVLGMLLSVLILPKDICLSKWIFSVCFQAFKPPRIQRRRPEHEMMSTSIVQTQKCSNMAQQQITTVMWWLCVFISIRRPMCKRLCRRENTAINASKILCAAAS